MPDRAQYKDELSPAPAPGAIGQATAAPGAGWASYCQLYDSLVSLMGKPEDNDMLEMSLDIAETR